MNATLDNLPLERTEQPTSPEALAEVVREAHETETPVYPIGGGCSLNFGLPAKKPGIGLSLTALHRVIDYPARDMTITVEAGATMAQLRDTLLAERQQLPIDVPLTDRATIGGVVATNWNGPRRYGYGAVRDFVIGIGAVDGRGRAFKGGGRVVKNVAGYDFCKLLTGSLGTLAVITQVTLKVRPLSEASVLLACRAFDEEHAERLLAALAHSATSPCAIELLGGDAWHDIGEQLGGGGERELTLVVGLEGTRTEVDWMQQRLAAEWRELNATKSQAFAGGDATALWQRLDDFAENGESPLVVRANVMPSGVAPMIHAFRQVDAGCSIHAHAGNGVVTATFADTPAEGLSRTLLSRLQPVAS
ncbi:MAG: FAD-binding oxidoreductase, partial [Planctomycetales bacterium]|nr:FAD-binding oxidoreductase [Planctomycetales bacterium]